MPRTQEEHVEIPSQILEEHSRIVREQLGEPIEDVYVGESPEKLEEIEAEVGDDPGADAGGDLTETRIRLLEEELAENRRLISKLALQNGGVNADEMARDVSAMEDEAHWQKIFRRIKKNGGFCTIVIHSSDDPTKNTPVFVGVNGRGVTLERNKPLKVHVSVLEVLAHSQVNGIQPLVNEATGDRTWVPIRYMCYPFSLLDQGSGAGANNGKLVV